MSNPTRAQFHTDKTLTDQSLAIRQEKEGFVADVFAPSVYTPDQSGLYVVYEDGDFNRDEMELRGPSSEAAVGGYNLSRVEYKIHRKAFAIDTDYVESSDADEVIDVEEDAVDYCVMKEMIHREGLFSTAFLTAGNPGDTWSYDVDGVASNPTAAASFDPTNAALNDRLKWTVSNSTPLWDVGQARLHIAKSGLRANTMLVTYDTYEALLAHADIIAAVAGAAGPGNPAVADESDLAKIFRVERFLVMSGIKNAAKKGQVASNAFFASGAALLAYVAPGTARRKTASAAYTYTLRNSKVDGLSEVGTRLRRLELETKTSFRVEIEQYIAPVVMAKSLGCFFGGMV